MKTLHILERLKVCWYVLTRRNFVFSSYSKHMLTEDENGYLTGPTKNSIKGYYHIDEETFVVEPKGNMTLRDLICDNISHVVEKIKSREL